MGGGGGCGEPPPASIRGIWGIWEVGGGPEGFGVGGGARCPPPRFPFFSLFSSFFSSFSPLPSRGGLRLRPLLRGGEAAAGGTAPPAAGSTAQPPHSPLTAPSQPPTGEKKNQEQRLGGSLGLSAKALPENEALARCPASPSDKGADKLVLCSPMKVTSLFYYFFNFFFLPAQRLRLGVVFAQGFPADSIFRLPCVSHSLPGFLLFSQTCGACEGGRRNGSCVTGRLKHRDNECFFFHVSVILCFAGR